MNRGLLDGEDPTSPALQDQIMDSNINDSAGIAALLEKLKSSTAWQELTASTSTLNDSTQTIAVPSVSEHSTSHGPLSLTEQNAWNEARDLAVSGSTVASLLSQLHEFSNEPDSSDPSNTFDHGYDALRGSSSVTLQTLPSILDERARLSRDQSKLTFRQALPLVSELVDHESFATEINKMRSRQDSLEHRLWRDREAIYTKYQDKIKVAQAKAQMIGVAISQHELNMITDAFKKELSKFDLERAIPAWDGLISRQQLELAQLNVPTMCTTGDKEHLQRQLQVVQLIESLLGPKAPSLV